MFESGYLPMLGTISWSQVSVTDLRQILQFTGKKWGHQYIVRYWRRTAFITRWLSLWSLGFLCPFCFGPFLVPAGLSLVCFLLQLVLKRWHQNVIINSSIKRNNLHCSVITLFLLPPSPPQSLLLLPAKGFQGGRSRSVLWFLITPVLHLSSGKKHSSAVIRKWHRHALRTHRSHLDHLRNWKTWELQEERSWKKIVPHMANRASSLLLVDKPLSVLHTCTQRESEWAILKTEALLHVKLSISSSSSVIKCSQHDCSSTTS